MDEWGEGGRAGRRWREARREEGREDRAGSCKDRVEGNVGRECGWKAERE